MNMMKQWLAIMIILVIEWADVGTSTEVQVEQKDGMAGCLELLCACAMPTAFFSDSG